MRGKRENQRDKHDSETKLIFWSRNRKLLKLFIIKHKYIFVYIYVETLLYEYLCLYCCFFVVHKWFMFQGSFVFSYMSFAYYSITFTRNFCLSSFWNYFFPILQCFVLLYFFLMALPQPHITFISSFRYHYCHFAFIQLWQLFYL